MPCTFDAGTWRLTRTQDIPPRRLENGQIGRGHAFSWVYDAITGLRTHEAEILLLQGGQWLTVRNEAYTYTIHDELPPEAAAWYERARAALTRGSD